MSQKWMIAYHPLLPEWGEGFNDMKQGIIDLAELTSLHLRKLHKCDIESHFL
jgi:hypothetical protein